MRMKTSWLLGTLLALVAGCPETPPPVIPTDVPRDGGIDAPFDGTLPDVPFDGMLPDVPFDGMLPDVPVDVPPLPDAPFDAGPEEDVLIMGVDAGCTDTCACIDHPMPCSAGCDMDEVCITDGCVDVCAPPGAECGSAADCPAGSLCKSIGGGLYCLRSGCADSRDCPRGFACEAGACADRRVGCGGADGAADCPYNFYCDSSTGPAHCSRVLRPCGTGSCPLGGTCADVDGDGDNECVHDGGCTTNAECGAGSTCSGDPLTTLSICSRYGPCRTEADCTSGQLCVDLWGDRLRECIDPGGECLGIEDCDPGEICGTPSTGGPTVCITRSFPL